MKGAKKKVLFQPSTGRVTRATTRGENQQPRSASAPRLGDPQISLPDKMELIRQKVTQGLNRTHERAEKAYNTRSKLVEFSVGQVVYRKNYKQSNKADGYNAKLGPNRIRCVVLQHKGKAL